MLVVYFCYEGARRLISHRGGDTDRPGRAAHPRLPHLPRGCTAGIDPGLIDAELHAVEGVVDVHDLHVWEVASGFPALSVHLLVAPDRDCHERREVVRHLLETGYGITHQTVQIEHREPVQGLPNPTYRTSDPAARRRPRRRRATRALRR